MAGEERVREVGRRVLHEGPVGSFGLYELELPGGERVTLPLIRHPGAAAVVPFLDDGRVLLIRQYRFAADGVIWEVPAGKREPGEAPEVCAARELEEETGYRAGRLERTGEILTTPGFSDEVIHLFCAFDLTPGRLQREPSRPDARRRSSKLHEQGDDPPQAQHHDAAQRQVSQAPQRDQHGAGRDHGQIEQYGVQDHD